MNWFTHRPEIKLLALGLAVALYFFTATQITTEKHLTIEIDREKHIQIEDNWVVSSITPEKLDIVVVGPMSVIDELNDEDLHPLFAVSPDHLGEGRQRFDVNERLLRLPAAVSLKLQPRSVVIEFSELITTELSLDDRLVVEGIPPGYSVSTQLVDRAVLVRGPKSVIEELRQQGKIAVEKVMAPELSPEDLQKSYSFNWPIVVLKPHKAVDLLGKGDLRVTITVDPIPAIKQTPALPIQVLLNPGDQQKFAADLASKEVVLDVSGPSAQLGEYDLTKLRAYIDLTDPMTLDMPEVKDIHLLKPRWMEYTPRTIKVTLRRRSVDGTPPVGLDPIESLVPPPTDPVPPPVEPPAPNP